MTKPSPSFLLFLTLSALLHNAWYWPMLPPVVASHFNGSGIANGWMPRQGFAMLYAGMVILTAGIFLLIGRFLGKIPGQFINLPNKAYWLDPSRREETLSYIRQWSYRFGSATVLFLMTIMHLVIRVNLGKEQALHPLFPWALGAYVSVAAFMTVALVRRFGRVSAEGSKGRS